MKVLTWFLTRHVQTVPLAALAKAISAELHTRAAEAIRSVAISTAP